MSRVRSFLLVWTMTRITDTCTVAVRSIPDKLTISVPGMLATCISLVAGKQDPILDLE